jgi:hypothetical protein
MVSKVMAGRVVEEAFYRWSKLTIARAKVSRRGPATIELLDDVQVARVELERRKIGADHLPHFIELAL